jgi:hypothetical protein
MTLRPITLTAAALAAVSAFALAQQPSTKPAHPTTPAKPAAAPQGEKPSIPGMSDEDMKACAEAGTPGPQHALLARSAGTYSGKCTMYMQPGADPMRSECTVTVTPIMGGRFVRWESSGDVPGMGPMQGSGTYGYDNVGKQYQANWITNCGTGMMNGTGEVSEDGKTITWSYMYNCPLTKGPAKLRDVETHPSADTINVTTYGPDATGKEYKMAEMMLTRQSKTTSSSAR